MDVTTNDTARFDPIEAFSKLDNTDAEKPSDEVKEKDTAEDPETPETPEDGDEKSTDDEGAEDAEKQDESEGQAEDDLSDDRKLKVPVDGEEIEVTLGSLKRLAGQEAALTRKSQEVATARKTLDETATTHIAALDKLLERARQRYEPYSKIDFLVASKDPNVSGEELAAVRQAAVAAYEDVQFLEQELGAFSQQLTMRKHAELAAQAKETLKSLSDPEKGIPGFNQQLYTDMRSYAIEQGIPAQVIDQTVDELSLRLLHKAMLYDKGAKKVKEEKPESKKPPKRIVKSTSNPEVARKITKEAAGKKAFNELAQRYTFDNAVAAFEERFSRKRSDD